MNIFAKMYGGAMDRRQKKTRDAIFSAFGALLERKRYENITVQEIIDTANICRSTFYTHFETKDMLLREMCADIFDHIFEGGICEYGKDSKTLDEKLSHILWHLFESRGRVIGILASDSGYIFMRYLREYLTQLFCLHADDFKVSVPRTFLINYLTGSFSEVLKWWVREGMETPPAQVARYFIEVTETH